MKTYIINICKRDGDNLIVLDHKKMKVQLDEEKMELFTLYNKKRYIVDGVGTFLYIEKEEVTCQH